MEEVTSHADPVMVDKLISSMGTGIRKAVVPGITTQADILSAVFTVLHRMLEAAQEMEDPTDHDKNAKEVSRVLMDLLVTFGTAGAVN